MSKKPKVPIEDLIQSIKEYLSGKKGFKEILQNIPMSKEAFRRNVLKYQYFGSEALLKSSKNRNYPLALKEQAIEDYLNGKASMVQLSLTYKISSPSILERWIKKYNGHEKNKSQHFIGDKIMTNGRKTTFEERIASISFCIENEDNYHITAEKFQVSYQQIYTWVKKYREGGPEALQDRRGKCKDHNAMTDIERQNAQIKLLEAENKRLQIENDFLKKLKDVERRRLGKTNI